MTNEELIQLKKNKSILEKIRLEKIKFKIKELEKDPKVKEYIAFCNTHNVNYDTTSYVDNEFKKTWDKFGCKSSGNYNIFYEFGRYDCSSIKPNSTKNFNLYKNIENNDWYYLDENNKMIKLSEYFNTKNYFVGLNIPYGVTKDKFYNDLKKYENLRTLFFEKLIFESYESAIDSIACDKIVIFDEEKVNKTKKR